MHSNKVFVLGAYGQVGRSVCRVLLEHTDAAITLGGRRIEKLESLAQAINKPGRVTACFADACQPESLNAAFRGMDLVILTATARNCIEHVSRACIECGCDYMDTLETEDVVLALRKLEPEMQRAGRLFMTQCGLSPGVSAAMVRHAHGAFSRLRRARVATAFSFQTIERKEQVYDLFEFVVKNKPMVYRDGEWRRQSLSEDCVVIDCGPRFGRRHAFPLDMIETRGLPAALNLESFGHYVTSANRFVDLAARRLLTTLYRIKPRLGWAVLAALSLWLAKTQREPCGGAVVVEADGDGGRGGRSLHLLIDVEDNYLGVGQAVVVVARQCLADVFRGKVGVHIMGELVDPDRTLADLAALGVPCREAWRTTPLADGWQAR
ncbi:MAG: saccharopine dehydrogenase NADP-binding domain-containing protein [Vicinamibacteria bacterium]|nr:saccharopine dehydrogenase NADP-binding domain-containing protein [Vicinamibacteria bacterium]